LSLYDDDGTELLFGTVDATKLFREERRAVVGDWKFGRIAVDSPDSNLQLATYSAAIMQKHEFVESCKAVVIQPRLEWAEHPEFTFTNCAGIVKTVKIFIARCQAADAPLMSGTHCRYCKAKHKCPPYRAYETAVVSVNKRMLTEDNVRICHLAVKAMRVAVTMANEAIKEFILDNDGEIGGLYIAEINGNRQVRDGDVNAFYDELSEYMTLEEFLMYCKPTFGELEAEIARRLKEDGIFETLKEGKAAFNQLETIEKLKKQKIRIREGK